MRVSILKDNFVRIIRNGGSIEFRQPFLQYGGGRSCGLQLPQGNPDRGTAVAVQRDGKLRRRLAQSDRVDHPAFDRKILGKSKALEHPLKRIMACGVEQVACAAERMAGIKMRA